MAEPPNKPTPSESLNEGAPTSVDIFYEKAAQHRTVYSDGVWASLTPSLELQLAFFKNLAPVPEYIRQEVTPDQSLGKELEQAVKKGMIREYETTVVLTRETAESMIGLLRRILDQTKDIETSKGVQNAMTPQDQLPAISPHARFIRFQTAEQVISAPSSQDFWRAVVHAPSNPQGLSGILSAIDALQLNEDEDGYIFKPKPYASNNAKVRLKYAYASLDAQVRDRLPLPSVVPDGTGGIVIQWNRGDRSLNAGFPPDHRRRDYLYYEDDEIYRLIRATLTNLKEHLEWLIHE